MTRGRDLKFYYDEESGDILIKWVNGVVFKVVLGKRENENTTELKHTLHKLIKHDYKISQSSLYFDKNNHLILNLTLDIDFNKVSDLVSGRVCGVDLGIKYPAYVCLNDETYIRQSIGDYDDFFKVRTQMRARKFRLQRNLTSAKGGNGRKRKLQALHRFKEKESQFAKTYNHMISHKVVEFAKKNKCEFIHLEKLTGDGLSHQVLSNWSFYDLQQKIEYKADRVGIVVRYVDPAYTSQTCSNCGYVDKDNRPTQSDFECISCGAKMNADHNASINIARSTNFVK
jgi:IS605 OrfB family transposase